MIRTRATLIFLGIVLLPLGSVLSQPNNWLVFAFIVDGVGVATLPQSKGEQDNANIIAWV